MLLGIGDGLVARHWALCAVANLLHNNRYSNLPRYATNLIQKRDHALLIGWLTLRLVPLVCLVVSHSLTVGRVCWCWCLWHMRLPTMQ
jgi:hypothetical protein